MDLALYQRDFRTSPRVWRRIRVSGGTSLEALQDKVLTPAMVRPQGRLIWPECQ